MDYIELIKNQYFSQKNLDFIISMVKRNTGLIISHETVFKIGNNVFNSFMHTMYIQKKNINPSSIEELLITLNKMTIENIIKENESTQMNESVELNQHNQYNQNDEPIPKENIELTVVNTNTNTNTNHIKTQTDSVDICDNKIFKTENLYIFSNDYLFENEAYHIEIRKQNIKSLRLCELELYNNLYNINELNNKIEFMENNTKKSIFIPVGCYNLDTLLDTLEKQLQDKFNSSNYKIVHNPTKNRITISNDKTFSFTFIENDSVIPLRYILGFSNKHHYINNTNYTSDSPPIINIYDNLYFRFSNVENEYLNTKYSKDFKFFSLLKFDHISTFGKSIPFTINESLKANNINDIKVEIYYRHVHHNKFYKLKSPVSLIFSFEIEYYI